ncbi:hypothetical protein HKD37_13G038158 [Glycine soja]
MYTELFAACVDRLETVKAKLAAAQASMDSKLDAILLKLNTMISRQPSPFSSLACKEVLILETK